MNRRLRPTASYSQGERAFYFEALKGRGPRGFTCSSPIAKRIAPRWGLPSSSMPQTGALPRPMEYKPVGLADENAIVGRPTDVWTRLPRTGRPTSSKSAIQRLRLLPDWVGTLAATMRPRR